jgi:hypothetical protein
MWDSLAKAGRNIKKEYNDFVNIPDRASSIAENRFPDSARDSSMKNAFRHSLGTGMITNKLGGGVLGATAAKLAGYGWESLGAAENIRNPEQWKDTKHDLNANAIGASVATQIGNQQQLEDMLEAMARRSSVREPLGAFEPSHGQMTRSRR